MVVTSLMLVRATRVIKNPLSGVVNSSFADGLTGVFDPMLTCEVERNALKRL